MPIEEIFKKATANDVISELKSCRFIPQPDVERAEKALNPKLHDINDPIIRKDKRVKIDADDEAESAQKIITVDGERTNYRTEKVARIALAIQRLIINRAVSFCFGNPINYNATPTNDNEALILHALNRILYDVKCNSLNRKIGRSIFGYKECAEYWYTVDKPNSKYGFKSKHKLRCALFSPAYGDTLYPYFDETGDMVAFSRAFSRKDAGENAVDYFETFTDKEHWLWINGANGYEAAPGYPKPIKIGKIPIIYGHQPKFETEDVDKLIDRLETLLSNFEAYSIFSISSFSLSAFFTPTLEPEFEGFTNIGNSKFSVIHIRKCPQGCAQTHFSYSLPLRGTPSILEGELDFLHILGGICAPKAPPLLL